MPMRAKQPRWSSLFRQTARTRWWQPMRLFHQRSPSSLQMTKMMTTPTTIATKDVAAVVVAKTVTALQMMRHPLADQDVLARWVQDVMAIMGREASAPLRTIAEMITTVAITTGMNTPLGMADAIMAGAGSADMASSLSAACTIRGSHASPSDIVLVTVTEWHSGADPGVVAVTLVAAWPAGATSVVTAASVTWPASVASAVLVTHASAGVDRTLVITSTAPWRSDIEITTNAVAGVTR